MQSGQSEIVSSVGLLVLRVGVGGYMLTHGWRKLQMVLAGNLQWSDPIGLGPALSLILVTFAEFFCALLVIFGLATRLAAVPIVFAMGVAAFVAHGNDPWTASGAAAAFRAGEAATWGSKQPALIYLFAFLTLVFTGPGKFSLDSIVMPKVMDRLGWR